MASRDMANTRGTETPLTIAKDPTNTDPFNGDGTATTLVTVPEGAQRFVAAFRRDGTLTTRRRESASRTSDKSLRA